ncbi:glycosyltransferase family 2 protein [Niastella caeni]|uniref:Glycosyltransferase family 2 protein n=1 Tax=Niastella caeni TaxID=2569763 RepID=A0A4S8I1D3_9BACT|nr:glycosyltransferase family 2 protein [Niastella caeni]THU41725.1 glycosyltransferase family 2 protein [Niastella caeni]
MKISGFIIIRNAVINDYPVTEAIRSVLPMVDEMIVSIGNCEDDTLGLIQSIASDKIKIVHSVWDPALRKGGEVLAVETNKAFAHISPDSDWAFYIQADEVVHEKYYPVILEAAKKYKDQKEVEGLLFKYTHFYGTYNYVGDSRRWYNREIRLIRNDKSIYSYKDAQGFRKDGRKLLVKPIDAYIYHYGWVKSPKQMLQKQKNLGKFWRNDEEWAQLLSSADFWDFNNDFDSLVKFTGTHPAVMQERIKNQNWQIELDVSRKRFSFKNRLLYYVEKATGKRLFDYKNYKILR